MKNFSNTTTDVPNATTEFNHLTLSTVMTQREVAEAIGVSRVAIQQIENRAIKKIKRELKKRKLLSLDFII